jgi:hypothetical protein
VYVKPFSIILYFRDIKQVDMRASTMALALTVASAKNVVQLGKPLNHKAASPAGEIVSAAPVWRALLGKLFVSSVGRDCTSNFQVRHKLYHSTVPAAPTAPFLGYLENCLPSLATDT